MYLKKIHIQGFKSFADKTEIKFKDDITAIVGPNGSGKSNVSDAIRWVLGEQSVKSLRGSKMEDIIFAGTNKRRALSFCEVTIFFDNKDGSIPLEYNEVAVTRRMFRSGESEYYINKSSCRLKDVRAIFMDTGIGKDGYSIIGQGRIDEILSNKPEDRRNIFEEAAGIIKYKTKKEESERKLRNTEDNLVRINDLMSEISIQYNRLDKDSKKADEFLNLFEELKNLEVNIAIEEINSIDTQCNLINKDNKQVEKEIHDYEKLKEEKQQVFDRLQNNINNKEVQIETLRKEREDIISLKEKSKNDLSLLLEKENFYKKDLSRIREELSNIDKENIVLGKESLKLKENSKTSYKEHADAIVEYEKKEIELNYIDHELELLEGTIDEDSHEINLLYQKIADKKGELNSIDSLYLNSDDVILKLNNEKKIIQDKVGKISEKIDLLINKKDNLETEHEKLIKNKQVHEVEYRKLNEMKSENLAKIRELEINIERISSSYKLYKNMEYSYEGYYKSVKNLLKALEDKKIKDDGFNGAVVNLLSVDEKYEVAINISLGGNLQNIVVDNQETAKDMIAYLKENKLGRVTFLPIDTIKGKVLNIDFKETGSLGVLGLAYELVEYEKKYENIFKSLLGRTIIIDNIDNALKYAKKTNNIYRIVTLEGEVLSSGGSLSGGSYRDNISIINRKTKIENLADSLRKLKDELGELEDESLKLQNKIERSSNNLNELKNNIDNVNIDTINTKNDKNTLQNEINFLNKDMNKIKDELEIYKKNAKESLERSVENRNILENDISKLEDLKKELNLLTLNMSCKKDNRDKLYKEYSEVKINIKIIENKLLNQKNEIINIDKKIGDNNLLKITKIDEVTLTQKHLKEVTINRDIANDNIEVNLNKEINIDRDIKLTIGDKDKYMNSFYKEQNKLKEINEGINILERAKNDKELKLSKLILQRDNIESKLMNDYKLNIEEARKLKMPLENFKQVKSNIKILKEKIKHLGNVNLGALEEYKEVKERLEFMQTQHDDLIESKENLKIIIKDMEKEMRIHFSTSFEEIKDNFSEVFCDLFNGGTATLELDNENDDILKSGIEIKVKPPGKVLQSLSLLSGGEKSLVAVALLFAILKSKPSPFCILDEIDAALDDSNISRYTSYLKKINKETQFILITHRKTSMEIANVLYGVTMEEKGISKIISMELKENKNALVI